MEQKQLPNITIVIVLSILGLLCCCCLVGVPGLLFGGIGLILALKDEKTYKENPEAYSNYSQLKTAKILAIIALVVGALYLIYSIFMISQMGGMEVYLEKVNEMMEQYQNIK